MMTKGYDCAGETTVSEIAASQPNELADRRSIDNTTQTQDHLNQIDALKRELADAERTIARLQYEIDSIHFSVIWRATRPLRTILSKIPLRFRRRAVNLIKYVYRFFFYRLPRGVSLMRSTLGDKNQQAAVAHVDDLAVNYESWIRDFDTLSEADREQISQHIGTFRSRPLISVVMPVYQTPEHVLREAIESLINQLYPHWELCIADDASTAPHIRDVLDAYSAKDSRIKCAYRQSNGHISEASNTAFALATGEYVALLDHDDVLSDHALYMVAEAIQRHPAADVFYSDEDKLDANGKRCDPHFKPDWSPELFYGQNYLNHLTVYRRSAIEAVGGFRTGFEGSQDYDLALRVIKATKGPVVHIPHVLYHWRIYDGAGTMSSDNLHKATSAARQALREHFADAGPAVRIEGVMGSFHRVVRPDPSPWPRVSVIVPTRDYLDVLRMAIDGLENRSDYPDLEIIIADNESVEPETLAYLAAAKARGIHIVECAGAFNYSHINNLAVATSTGEYVLLLNNDISMIESGWLKEMVRHFADPEVGIVGPKLLYPDGTLQHAGVVIGIGGVAGHRYVRFPGDYTGPFCRLALAQDVGAVTGACLLIRRTVFDEVGGLDADNLAVAFNDIDLCLKVRSAGYRIIWTPHAVLEHHESKSRGLDLSGEKQVRFQREVLFMRAKWSQRLDDPYYNPNLSMMTLSPSFACPPRLFHPWKP